MIKYKNFDYVRFIHEVFGPATHNYKWNVDRPGWNSLKEIEKDIGVGISEPHILRGMMSEEVYDKITLKIGADWLNSFFPSEKEEREMSQEDLTCLMLVGLDYFNKTKKQKRIGRPMGNSRETENLCIKDKDAVEITALPEKRFSRKKFFNLGRLCQAKDLTQEEVASVLGTTQSTVSRMITMCHGIDNAQYEKLEKAYGKEIVERCTKINDDQYTCNPFQTEDYNAPRMIEERSDPYKNDPDFLTTVQATRYCGMPFYDIANSLGIKTVRFKNCSYYRKKDVELIKQKYNEENGAPLSQQIETAKEEKKKAEQIFLDTFMFSLETKFDLLFAKIEELQRSINGQVKTDDSLPSDAPIEETSHAQLLKDMKREASDILKEFLDVWKTRQAFFVKGCLSEVKPKDGVRVQTGTVALTNNQKEALIELKRHYGADMLRKIFMVYCDSIFLGRTKYPAKLTADLYDKQDDVYDFKKADELLDYYNNSYTTDETTGFIAPKEAIEKKWYLRVFDVT